MKHTTHFGTRVLAGLLGLTLAACAADSESSGGRSGSGGSAGSGGFGNSSGGTSGSGNFGNSQQPTAGSIGAGTGAPAPTGGDCKAGHYVGSFNGVYRSAAWGNGTSMLNVAASDSMGMPGLEFWLEQAEAACMPGDEFCADFTVTGGKMRGFANPFSSGDPNDPANDPNNPLSLFTLKVPFTIDLNGALDCSRGELQLTLDNGQYDVATMIYKFRGTAGGDYDSATASVVNGTWEVTEEMNSGALWPADSMIGGEGTWEATLQP